MRRKYIIWSLASVVVAYFSIAIAPWFVVINCAPGNGYFNFNLLICTPWPRVLLGFQFVLVGVLLGPRRLPHIVFVMIALVYASAIEMMRFGEIAIIDIISVVIEIPHNSAMIYGGILGLAFCLLCKTLMDKYSK